MRKSLKRIVVIMGLLAMIGSLFGCGKSEEETTDTEVTGQSLPFDVEKAYKCRRRSTQTGTHWEVEYSKKDIVIYYTITDSVPEEDGFPVDGVADGGTTFYFVGQKPGEVKVTFYTIIDFDGGKKEEDFSFTLKVDDDLTVTRLD